MHQAKLQQVQEQIENGDAESVSWAEMWQEFSDMQDDRQLAALNRLSPGKLTLLINLCEKALPVSRKRSLEHYAQQAKRDGVDLQMLASYLINGEVPDEQFNSLPSVAKTEAPQPSKSRYLPRETLNARKKKIRELLAQGKETGEIANEIMRLGLSKTKASIYPAISLERNKLKNELTSEPGPVIADPEIKDDPNSQLANALVEAGI